MQSGTILHLALLKKLSSQAPTDNYSYRFANFRKKIRHRTPSQPSNSFQDTEQFQQYTRLEPNNPSGCKSSRSSRPSKTLKRKNTMISDKGQESVCGWSIENHDAFDYMMKVKKDNYTFFDDKITRKQLPKYVFCEDTAIHTVLPSKPSNRAPSLSTKARTKLKDQLIIECSNTEPVKDTKDRWKPVLINKQNLMFKQLEEKDGSEQKKDRSHPKEFIRSKKALTELRITTFKFNN